MVDNIKNEQAAGGKGGFILALALIILVGASSGAGFGLAFLGRPGAARSDAETGSGRARNSDTEHSARPSRTGEIDEPAQPHADRLMEHVVPLEPIIVSISGPGGTWLRLEGSVAFAGPPKDDRTAIAAQMTEDLFGFLRNTPLTQLESAAGLEFLRDDMSELVRLRTNGRARRFILRALVIE